MIRDSHGDAASVHALPGYRASEALFDRIGDTVYFVKDGAGRYVSVNQTLAERCGYARKDDLIGKRADEVFPAPMGTLITAQDERVLRSGRGLQSRLELHLYAGQREGWCLTWKEPLRDEAGAVIGLSGISRDVAKDIPRQADFAQISGVLDHIRENFHTPLRLSTLAAGAKMSNYQLNRRLKSLIGLSVSQCITRERIAHACDLLRHGSRPLSQIALECGYSDQAAFSRQFWQSLGMSPNRYREAFGT